MNKRFMEEQIVAVLNVTAVSGEDWATARRHGINETTRYRWRAKYGGKQQREVRRLRQLEDENALLANLVAGVSSPSTRTIEGRL